MDDNIPAKLRPYVFHGLVLGPISRAGNSECVATICPFCGKDRKFSVNAITGLWRCWSCATGSNRGGGNISTFLQFFHQACLRATKDADYEELCEDRGLMYPETPSQWELCKNYITGDWLVPGYNPSGTLTSLYRYVKQRDGVRRLLPTPTLGHHIHGMNLWSQDKPIVYICEGPWDAIALYEVLSRCKNSDRGLCATASVESSFYAQSNVIAVPGCEVFFEHWTKLFEGKIVNLLYDSDHPRTHPTTGHVTEGAGWRGMKRVTEIFVNSGHKPQELNCIHWGAEGYDVKRKSGFDVRDMLTRG